MNDSSESLARRSFWRKNSAIGFILDSDEGILESDKEHKSAKPFKDGADEIFTGTEDVQFIQAPYAGHEQERFAQRRGFHGLTLIAWILFIALMATLELLRMII